MKVIKILLRSLILSCLWLPVKAWTNSHVGVIQVASGRADYDGSDLELSQDVRVNHALGQLTANNALLRRSKQRSPNFFEELELNGNVLLTTPEGSELSCAKVKIEAENLVATCEGDLLNPFISYRETKQTPLEIRGKLLWAKMLQLGKSDSSTQRVISEVVVENDVIMLWNNDLRTICDQATYKRTAAVPHETPGLSLLGQIHLCMKAPEVSCHVTNERGDRIQATYIDIDTLKRTMVFEKPRGEIVADKEAKSSHVAFSADSMLWELPLDRMSLSGQVWAVMPSGTTLEVQKRLDLNYQKKASQHQLVAAEAHGYTQLKSPEKSGDHFHQITCQGSLFIDHVKLEIKLYSPRDAEGKVIEAQQLLFSDSLGEIRADDAFLTYHLVDGKAIPLLFKARGNVKLYDRQNSSEMAALHYALSDQVDFNFTNKEAVFKAYHSNRVLFYDKINNLQMSAPVLKIKRNETTKKESIQGVGDVRFSFMESEIQQLKEQFSRQPYRK